MRILFIGDIVAKPGRNLVKEILPDLIKKENIDFVIANAENIAHGRGATLGTLEEMMQVGVNYFTGGDHIYRNKEILDGIENLPLVIPANFPESNPGKRYSLVDTGKNGNILLVNLMGRVFSNNPLDDPFKKIDEILEEVANDKIAFSMVDLHAEVTSEKYAFAHYVDGRIGAVLGTHTHVPTCDTQVLPGNTMFVTDVGMTGIIDSVLGVKKEIIINRFLTGMPEKFEWENTGTKAFRSVILDTDKNSITRSDLVLD